MPWAVRAANAAWRADQKAVAVPDLTNAALFLFIALYYYTAEKGIIICRTRLTHGTRSLTQRDGRRRHQPVIVTAAASRDDDCDRGDDLAHAME